MAKERKIPRVTDPSAIANAVYSRSAGAQKNAEVGRHLVPLKSNATTFTTDATTARALPSKGRNIAIYNSGTTLHAVTLGDDASMSALSAGTVDASGNVGIPCAAGEWTYVACNERQFVRTDSAELFVFLIEDDTSI